MGIVIDIRNLRKEYPQNGHTPFCALCGVDLRIVSGEIITLFGKSGSGKSTLLNCIAGLDRPSSGVITIEGRPLDSYSEQDLTTLRRSRIGFIFQFFNLLPTLTVFENVMLSLELLNRRDERKALGLLASMGLEDKERRYPHELSGGEQQRVAIARALVKDPAIVLADEPTGNLDSRTGDEVLSLLSKHCRAIGATMLMVSHSTAASLHSDRELHMVDGLITDTAGTTP